MAYSRNIYTGDGITNTFAVNFVLGFLSRTHVFCHVEGELDGLLNPIPRVLTWITDGLVSIGTAPAAGLEIVIFRDTPKNALIHDYTDGAGIIEANLDRSNLQNIMLNHESLDGIGNSYEYSLVSAAIAEQVALDKIATATNAAQTAADVVTTAAAAANLPNLTTAGASKFLKTNAAGTAWEYPTTNELQNILGCVVKNLKQFGAIGDGIADDTAAINAAIASGESIFAPFGTYLTTGGHIIPYPSNQRFFSDTWGRTVIKKLSGNLDIFSVDQYSQCCFENLSIDGNNLGGRAFMWRGHYSFLKNIFIKNIAGTSYAIHVSGSNMCTFSDVNMYNCNGGWKIDNSTDPLVTKPTYGSLYSVWDHCSVDIRAASASHALYVDGSITGNLTFNNFYFEIATAGTTALGISINGSNIYNLAFNDTTCEVINTGAQIIEVTSGTVYKVKFNGGKFGVSEARTNPFFNISGCAGFELTGCYFSDLFSVSPATILLSGNTNVKIKYNTCSYLNNFVFINDYTGNSYISESNNVVRPYAGGPGVGSNTWNAVSPGLMVGTSGMTQVFNSNYLGPVLKKSTGGIAGVVNGSAASEGEIGEYIESVVGPVNAPANTVIGDLTTLTLTPGDWDITAIGMNAANDATITGMSILGIGTAAGNNLTGAVAGSTYARLLGPTSAADTALSISPVRKNISVTTTYYLKMYSTYSAGTPTWYGRISARRVR